MAKFKNIMTGVVLESDNNFVIKQLANSEAYKEIKKEEIKIEDKKNK